MNPNKALGLDGMNAYFYQKYRKVVGSDITKVILQLLNGNASLAFVNQTNNGDDV